jgi:hypothetical protein
MEFPLMVTYLTFIKMNSFDEKRIAVSLFLILNSKFNMSSKSKSKAKNVIRRQIFAG